MKLKDEVAIVTGLYHRHRSGHRPASRCRRSESRCDWPPRVQASPLPQDIRKEGHEAIFVQADISIEADVKRLVDKSG